MVTLDGLALLGYGKTISAPVFLFSEALKAMKTHGEIHGKERCLVGNQTLFELNTMERRLVWNH